MAKSHLLPLLTIIAFIGMVKSQNLTFTNPILDRRSADPAVLKVGNYYYLTLSDEEETVINVYKSDILTDFRHAQMHEAYRAKDGQRKLWASEMHQIDDSLFIYFAMDGVGLEKEKNHRMYVITTTLEDGPMGNWSEALQLMPDWESETLDGTIFQHKQSNSLYFVYASTWPDPGPGPRLALFITRMDDPFTISGRPEDALLLREPDSEWECHDSCIVEGPYFLHNEGVYYMIFSASAAFSSNYCLGMMAINDSLDPMNTGNWDYGTDACVFSGDPNESVFSPGHASFTTSMDDTETWMVYHASATEIVKDRIARIEKISWGLDGKPVFSKPHGPNSPIPVPSGQIHT